MGRKALIMGESGTGKTTSMRNLNPEKVAIVNPVGKELPFKGKFTTLDGITESKKIIKFMKEQVGTGKKVIAVDDFQYILSVPYMNRIKEAGWDKWNDFGANYFEIIEAVKELPDDVVVYFFTHTETLENGVTTIKLIGKLLREKITIEGLFTIVLRTGVNEGKYYFYTQNSGKDTVKSPLGMFNAYAIENDLNYVDEKIRSYYEIGENFKTDEEMAAADEAVAGDVAKPDTNGRRARGSSKASEPKAERKSRAQVEAENKEKQNAYLTDCDKAVDEAANGAEEVDFDKASAAIDKVPKPDLETPPRRTRSERKSEEGVQDGTTNTDHVSTVLKADTYFHVLANDNFIMKHKGDTVTTVDGGEILMEVITKEEFGEGIKRIAKEGNTVVGAMNPPESGEKAPRQRTPRNIKPTGDTEAPVQGTATTQEAETATGTTEAPATTGRKRRTR